jgi:glycosyltransferase involved in cell wall biosynthesis
MNPLPPVTRTTTLLDGTPKLSICILTYNRSRYLRKTVTQLFSEQQFDFTFEVLISDNASQDDTPAVVAELASQYKQIRYLRQTHNVGSEANMVAAYRQARGEYTMYLADDDLLLPPAVAQVVTYLEQHPNIAVCYTPWEIYDDVSKQSLGLFFRIDEEKIFSRSTAIELCNFIVQRHIFPEIFIYRSEALRKIMYHPHKTYWAFTHLANILNYGDVAFLPTLFYRSITRHWEGDQRDQEGNKQAKSEWDLYRGGVEYLMYRAFTYAGLSAIPAEQRRITQQMVQSFVDTRMKVALRMLVDSREYLSANELFARLLANSALTEEEITTYRGLLTLRAAVEALVETFRSLTRVRSLALCGTESADTICRLLAEFDDQVPITSLNDTILNTLPDKDGYLVLCGNGSQRESLVAAGFPPGQVWSEADLLRQYVL